MTSQPTPPSPNPSPSSPSSSFPKLFLRKSGTHRIYEGHPWVFQNEIDRIEGNVKNGDYLAAYDSRGQLLGSGIYNNQSRIVFRRYSRELQALDRSFLTTTIRKAIQYRRTLQPTPPPAERLVWSESDSLPGLVVDRYHDHLVIQTLTFAFAQRQPLIIEILTELLSPTCIIIRNDAPVRQREGLPLEKSVALGTYTPPTPISLHGIEYHLNLLEGQKTGFYLDQLHNYLTIAQHAKDRRVLDCFCNQGSFGLHAAQHGARSVHAIDQSEEAIALARTNANRNNLFNISFENANVFDALSTQENEKKQYDLIILDPPSFTRNTDQIQSALRGYHEIHRRALRLLAPGGLLATFCCSHNITAELWEKMINRAAASTRCQLRLRLRLTQASDHPILINVPETEYLKGLLLEKL
ncbi:MAG: class I SAM-dependent rRNA methyltransferase [Methylacidiphilales bacterium]|nr:class I SAM-dependent rRNA methyltransferase [Candidatus Methylacidiphilales bacterium]MDW8349237.1 class I SAM-dependent rRNA methyltransferase [Verrucomicrobiae bacterium]